MTDQEWREELVSELLRRNKISKERAEELLSKPIEEVIDDLRGLQLILSMAIAWEEMLGIKL